MNDDNRPRTEGPDVEQSLVLREDPTTKLINEKHHEVERRVADMLPLVIELGELLIAEKARIGHGPWQGWVSKHYHFSPDTAQNYMLLARQKPTVIGFRSVRQALTHVKRERRQAKSAARAAKVVELRPSTAKRNKEPGTATNPPAKEETRSISMTRAQFGRIGNCLHPDARPTKKERREVYKLFEALWPREPSRSKLN